jgi:membrane protein DedA with SNARE-associated domain
MLVLAVAGLLVGAALGQRFTVMILVPGTVVLLAVSIATGFTHANTAWSIALTAAIAATSMQIGYLIGIGVHHIFAARPSGRSPTLASPAASARPAARYR